MSLNEQRESPEKSYNYLIYCGGPSTQTHHEVVPSSLCEGHLHRHRALNRFFELNGKDFFCCDRCFQVLFLPGAIEEKT